MRKVLLVLILGVILVIVATSSFVTVDPTVYVYVTQFGRPVAIYDGSDNETDAGLHFRLPWPIQSVQRLDRRLQVFDLSGIELLTRDRNRNKIDKTLTIDAYVCWRIAGKEHVDLFVRRVGTPERARAILGQEISSQLVSEIGKPGRSMDDLIQVQKGKVDRRKMKELTANLLARQKKHAPKEYGIEVVDIRLRRFNYPPQVQDTIFQRIRSERDTQAAEYQRQGKTESAAIRSEAQKQKRIIEADARAAADQLKGAAIAEGDRIRNSAHRQERAFYKFLKKLEDYAKILGESKNILYLSTQREVFDLLLNPGGTLSPAKPSVAPPLKMKKGGK
jgi:membrane protease subunit HflC